MRAVYVFLFTFTLFFQNLVYGITCEQLTLEEKVGQLFMTYFDGEEVNEYAEKLIREAKIGGIIYYNHTNGLKNPSQVRQMSKNLQELAKKHIGIPIFIATDQEGGVISRLKTGFTEFPGNAAVAATGNLSYARESAYYMGNEMKAVGINFNLAPVVDINSNSKNPIIGLRSFGNDAKKVTDFGKESLVGFQTAGIIACLKHFPGHGDVTIDSHLGLPRVDKSLAELEKLELIPFKESVQMTPAIMTAHILFPQVDPEHCATLSPLFLQNLLREQCKFEGLLMTDSLVMEAVLIGKNLDEVAVEAFIAGNDLLLIGGRDPKKHVTAALHVNEIVHLCQVMIDAVKSGRISEKRLDESVRRILKLKNQWISFELLSNDDANEILQKKEHLTLAYKIAKEAFVVKKWEAETPIRHQDLVILVPKMLQEALNATDVLSLGKSVDIASFDFSSTEEELEDIKQKIQKATLVIFCSYDAWKFPKQKKLLKTIAECRPTVCLALGHPKDMEISPLVCGKLATLSPSFCALQQAINWLRSH